MKIEFDPVKSNKNFTERGISFELASQFNFNTALAFEDKRRNYGEQRFNALGLIDNRVHHITFTLRADVIRIISLRKANRREIQHYVNHQNA